MRTHESLTHQQPADWNQVAQRVIQHFKLPGVPGQLQPLQPLGSAGGFSGALFWKTQLPEGPYCLRRWPAGHPDPARLGWIHAVLLHVASQGFAGLPLPLPTFGNQTFLDYAGHLWELTPWLPGSADYRQNPSRRRLTAALHSLADFHLSAATFSGPGFSHQRFPGQGPAGSPLIAAPSPGLQQRRALLRSLLAEEGEQLAAAVRQGIHTDLDVRARQLLGAFQRLAPSLLVRVDAVADRPLPLQPCIRDIWHAHVLFVGDDVSGIVDFGAMRMEAVCADVARLLGSMVEDDLDGWRTGLEAYERRRPLDDFQRELVRLFDHTGTLLGGMNWLRWIYLDERVFDWPPVLGRIDETLQRLRHL